MIQLGVGTRDEAWGTVRADADLIALLMAGWSVAVEVGEEEEPAEDTVHPCRCGDSGGQP